MLAAGRPKAAIAKFLYVSESTLRRWLARTKAVGAMQAIGHKLGQAR
jgi:transposase